MKSNCTWFKNNKQLITKRTSTLSNNGFANIDETIESNKFISFYTIFTDQVWFYVSAMCSHSSLRWHLFITWDSPGAAQHFNAQKSTGVWWEALVALLEHSGKFSALQQSTCASNVLLPLCRCHLKGASCTQKVSQPQPSAGERENESHLLRLCYQNQDDRGRADCCVTFVSQMKFIKGESECRLFDVPANKWQ